MKQFFCIFGFEFKGYLKNKIFVGITLVLVTLSAVLMFYPRISEGLGGGGDLPPEDKPILLLSVEDEALREVTLAGFTGAFSGHEVSLSEEDDETLREMIRSGMAQCAFLIRDLSDFTYLVYDLTLYDTNAALASGVLAEIYRTNRMLQSGMTPEQIAELGAFLPQSKTETLGQDQATNYFYTYIMLMALYMVILLYGQLVATNVASEKSSRAMELLITGASPVNMMFGKVIASCVAGLCQLIAVFGSAILFYSINRSYLDENEILSSIFNIPPILLLYMLLFFILGFFLYAFLFGAIGSTASKLEDINVSTMPLMFLFIIAFMVVMFSMSSGDLNNPIMVICSYFPFTSPMAMFTRIAMSVVPWYEIAISVLLLVVSVIGVGFLAAKIYRVGVLLYGTPPKLSAILKAMRHRS